MIKLSKFGDVYFNISSFILRWEPSEKKCEKKCFALFILVGSMKCSRGQLYTAKMWAWIVKFVWKGKSMFVIMAMREAIYTLILKTSPQNVSDVAKNKLKMAKYRWNFTDSNKAIFDLINCDQASTVRAHRNYYTYLYRTSQWLKPLVSDSLGYTE